MLINNNVGFLHTIATISELPSYIIDKRHRHCIIKIIQKNSDKEVYSLKVGAIIET